jgi:pimeloyl-ACP methyl ester carboxylesterase
LDGTGKLFAEFLKVMDLNVSTLVVAYLKDIPMNYDQLEVLVTAALPTDRPFVLLGESFCGPLAIRIAARQPASLVGLILCVTFASNPCRIERRDNWSGLWPAYRPRWCSNELAHCSPWMKPKP